VFGPANPDCRWPGLPCVGEQENVKPVENIN